MIDKGIVISHLVLWIDSNIEHRLSVEDVAKKSGYSKWHLQRVFYQMKGENIAAYIRDRKLTLAANDLVKSHDKILDISFRYGFDSQQSFTRSFSRKYRIPPQKYRRLYAERHY